jgi:hypothetical protein
MTTFTIPCFIANGDTIRQSSLTVSFDQGDLARQERRNTRFARHQATQDPGIKPAFPRVLAETTYPKPALSNP